MYYLRSKVIKTARLRFAVSFIAAYTFGALAVWLYLHRADGPYYISAALVSHFLSGFSFLLFTSPKPRALPGIGFYYPRIAALFTIFMPVLGLLGISLTLLMSRVFMESHGLAEEYKEKAYEGQGTEVDLPNDVTEFLYDEVDVHPIADVLAGDDVGMKRGAVNLLRRIGSAEAVKLLRKSISDENAEVRFYAHTALTRLEEDYAEALEKARFKVERYDSAQTHAELAITCRNYARSGLPEKNMQEQSMTQACEHWEIAVEKNPDNQDFKMRLAEAYCESARYSQALDIYKNTVSTPEDELESRLGICRIYFELGNYLAFFDQINEMRSRPVPQSSDPFRLNTYNFWRSFLDENEESRDLVENVDTDGVVI